MCDILRQEIMQDNGHSKLKAKTLDLITKLRLEANVLNANKTARNTTSSVQGKSVKETTENEKPEKEPLGLDENGQIKLTHDAEDIKQMLEMGMLKQSHGAPSQKASVMGASTGGENMRNTLAKLPSQKEVSKQSSHQEDVRPQNKTMTELKAKQVAEFSVESVGQFDHTEEKTESGIQAKEHEILSKGPDPPLLSARGPQGNFSTFDGDVDSEFAGKMEQFVKDSIEQAYGELSVKVRVVRKELEEEFKNQLDQVRSGYTGQILETQAAMSSIQSEQDAMLEKVKKSQAELLLINRNIAGNLKKLRQDQVDIGQKANVNQQLIVHLIDQALVMESTLSQHMETTNGKNQNLNNISVNLNQSQITDRHKTSYMSS